jgi:hypothetical protein
MKLYPCAVRAVQGFLFGLPSEMCKNHCRGTDESLPQRLRLICASFLGASHTAICSLISLSPFKFVYVTSNGT